MQSRNPLVALIAGALLAAGTGPGAGSAEATTTTCSFGGPTPSYRAIRLDLPEGSHFLGLELRGTRSQRPTGDGGNWHLAQGIAIFDVSTGEIEAFNVSSSGSFPRRTVVRSDGETLVDHPDIGPDAPMGRSASRMRAGLRPGSYYVVGFGTDGSRSLPNEWWAADVRVAGTHACTPIGSGEVFDHSHADFTGGTQMSTFGAGHGEATTLGFETSRQLVFGLMDASVYGPGDMELGYTTPTGSGVLDDEIIAFHSGAGAYSFEASYSGLFPVVAIAGVALDLA